jgi:thioredoxin reductase
MRPEIQAYFRSVAEKYRLVDHVRFHSIVEKAAWNDLDSVWEATILDLQTKERTVRRAKILVSSVGSLSVPKKCELPGVETYGGKMFHSAQWDHSFDWKDKDVVVLGISHVYLSTFISFLGMLTIHQVTAAQQLNSSQSWQTNRALCENLCSSGGKRST